MDQFQFSNEKKNVPSSIEHPLPFQHLSRFVSLCFLSLSFSFRVYSPVRPPSLRPWSSAFTSSRFYLTLKLHMKIIIFKKHKKIHTCSTHKHTTFQTHNRSPPGSVRWLRDLFLLHGSVHGPRQCPARRRRSQGPQTELVDGTCGLDEGSNRKRRRREQYSTHVLTTPPVLVGVAQQQQFIRRKIFSSVCVCARDKTLDLGMCPMSFLFATM